MLKGEVGADTLESVCTICKLRPAELMADVITVALKKSGVTESQLKEITKKLAALDESKLEKLPSICSHMMHGELGIDTVESVCDLCGIALPELMADVVTAALRKSGVAVSRLKSIGTANPGNQLRASVIEGGRECGSDSTSEQEDNFRPP